jgi:hypothetical protein
MCVRRRVLMRMDMRVNLARRVGVGVNMGKLCQSFRIAAATISTHD